MRSLLRSLTKSPGFTTIVVIVLALGVGANTAIFSVVNAVLLHPFPYPDSDRILFVGSTRLDQEGTMPVTYPDYQDWSASPRQHLEHLAWASNRSVALTGTGEATWVTSASVTASAWDLLGLPPLLGRTFAAAEDRPGAEPVCVLSYSTWQTFYGGDPAVLERTAMLDGRAYQIIGVMPPRFKFWAGDFWVPAGLEADTEFMRNRLFRSNTWVVAKTKPGVSLEQANAELNLLAAQVARAYPDTNTGVGASARLLSESVTGPFRQPLVVLLIAVACVLLIACANVANLLLAQTASRQREFAIRVALGASRTQLIRQTLGECLPLTLLGGFAGILCGAWALPAILSILPADAVPAEAQIEVNLPVMFASLGFVTLTMLAFGLFPAFTGSRPQLAENLQEGAKGTTNRRTARIRATLIVAEVTLSLTLLIGAGLLIRSLGRLSGVHPGFDASQLLLAQIQLPDSRYTTGVQSTQFYQRLLEDLRRVPGARHVGATTNPPFLNGSGLSLLVEGRSYGSLDDLEGVQFAGVLGDYFAAQGLQLVKGRLFTEADQAGSQPVIILNEATVDRFLPDVDPLGQRVMIGLPENLVKPGMIPAEFASAHWATVVGIVRSSRHFGLQSEPTRIAYQPVEQMWEATLFRNDMTAFIRTAADPLAAAPSVRATLSAIDPDLPLSRITTMETVIGDTLRPSRFNTVLLGLFAGIALMLAVVGIYGVVAWNVTQRTREIGIRQALGAQRRDVLRLVVGQGMGVVLIGVGLGLLTSLAVARGLQSLLFEVSAFDPWTFALVGMLLGAIALLACLLPALRAARVSPLEALRAD